MWKKKNNEIKFFLNKCQNYYKFYNEKFTNLTRISLLSLKKYNK